MITEIDEYGIFKSHLANDEYIIWKGKPEKGRLFKAEDVFLIPFTIVWCGGVLLWTSFAVSDVILPFIPIGIFFSAVGLYISVGRFIHKSYRRKNTRYIITNKRVLACCKNRINMVNRSCIFQMNMKVFKNGNGTITFEDGTSSKRDIGFLDFLSNKVSLENISDVATVYKILAQKTV